MRISRLSCVAVIGVVAMTAARGSAQSSPPIEYSASDTATGTVDVGAAQADNASGAFSFALPFFMPAGRGGVSPSLSLRYNSNWRDREAGYGWGLELPKIEVAPLSGFPEFASDGNVAGDARYAFNGQPLVDLCAVGDAAPECAASAHPAWAGGWRHYRLQVEGLFARFYRHLSNQTWRVQFKGGQLLELGMPRPGDPNATGDAIDVDPTWPTVGVVRWNLVRILDPHPKNRAVLKWGRDARQLSYLTDIWYTASLGSDSLDEFAYHVQLDWEDLPYPITKYAFVDRAAPAKRLTRVSTASKSWTADGEREVDRMYRLSYRATRTTTYDPVTTAPLWNHSFLASVQEHGRCGMLESGGVVPNTVCEAAARPPVRFEYEPGVLQNGAATTQPAWLDLPSGGVYPNAVPAPSPVTAAASALPIIGSIALRDFNGDGLPDLVLGWPGGGSCWTSGDDSGWKLSTQISGDPGIHCVRRSPDTGAWIEERKWRARPIVGYVNDGASPGGALRYQCMDAGSGGSGTFPAANNQRTPSFLSHAAPTVLGSWGTVQAVTLVPPWPQEDPATPTQLYHYPLLARPLTGTSNSGCTLGSEPMNLATFSPKWAWDIPADDWTKKTGGTIAWQDADKPRSFVDVDGDGLPDALVVEPSSAVAGPDLFWGRTLFTRQYARNALVPNSPHVGPALAPYSRAIGPGLTLTPAKEVRTWPWGTPNTAFWYADINGDGHNDFVMIHPDDLGGVPYVRPGDGRGRFACTGAGQAAASPWNCEAATGQYAYRIDVQAVRKPWVPDPPPPVGPAGLTSAFHFHDVTGDGLADIVMWDQTRIFVWVNLDGRRFDCVGSGPEPCLVADVGVTPAQAESRVYGKPSLRFADMNADGVDDIVLLMRERIKVVPFFQPHAYIAGENARSPRPGLLRKIDNGRGAATSIVYRSFQELDFASRLTATPWQHHTPLVSMAVTRISTANTSSVTAPFDVDRRTEFLYQDPAYDRWKRRHIGFRKVARRDGLEDAITETTYWFGPCENNRVRARPLGGAAAPPPCANGSDDDRPDAPTYRALVGRPVRIDRYVPQGARQPGRLWTRYLQYTSSELFQRDRNVVFAYAATEQTRHFDSLLATSPGSAVQPDPDGDIIETLPNQTGARTTKSEQAIDANGNVRWQVEEGESGVDERRYTMYSDAPPSGSEPAITCNREWQCLPTYVTGSPIQFSSWGRQTRLSYNGAGEVVKVEGFLAEALPSTRRFDGTGTFSAAPPGQATAGWKTLAEYAYDPNTGVVTQVDGPGSAGSSPRESTLLVLDTQYGQFPSTTVRYTNAAQSTALFTSTSFDRAFGAAVASIAPNGGLSAVELDPYGRPSKIFSPEADDVGFMELTSEIVYVDQSPASLVEAKRYRSPTVVISSTSIQNALGETVLRLDKRAGTSWTVSQWVERGIDGRARQTRRPFTTTTSPATIASGASAPAAPASGFVVERDDYGREARVRDQTPSGFVDVRTFAYGPLRASVKDAEQVTGGSHVGARRETVLDGYGRTKQQLVYATTSPSLVTTSFAYNIFDDPLLVQKIDGLGQTYQRSIAWDSLGRLTDNVEPNTGNATQHWRYTWDDANRLVGTTDARGCGKDLSYDALGRMTAENYSPCKEHQRTYDAAPEVAYTYDGYQSGQLQSETSFADSAMLANGQLVSVEDRGAHTRFNYDNNQRVRRASRKVNSPTGVFSENRWYKSRLDYDLSNRLHRRTTGIDRAEYLVGGRSEETLAYDALGALSRIESSYGVMIDRITYEPDGQVGLVRYGDAAATEARMAYDERRRLSQYLVTRVPPPLWGASYPDYPQPGWDTTQLQLADFRFTRDRVGNPTVIEDFASTSNFPATHWPVRRRQMAYDDSYRTTSVSYAYGTSLGNAPFMSPYDFEVRHADLRPIPLLSLANRLRSQSFTYDFMGNTTSTIDDQGADYDRSLSNVNHGQPLDGPNQLRGANGVSAVYDESGNLIQLKVRRRTGTCPSGIGSLCGQWLAYDWDEVGQLARARRWDFTSALPGLPAGQVPASTPTWTVEYAYSQGARVRKSVTNAAGVTRHTLDVFSTLRFSDVPWSDSASDYGWGNDSAHLFVGGIGHVVRDGDDSLPKSPAGTGILHTFMTIGDHLGSASVVLEHDSGELAERTTFEAFGSTESDYRPERWGAFREDAKFTGKEIDLEVGLTYFGARYYQTHLGSAVERRDDHRDDPEGSGGYPGLRLVSGPIGTTSPSPPRTRIRPTTSPASGPGPRRSR